MSIRKYFANKSTTITNAFQSNLQTRGTGSNMGESDIIEVFSIFGQANSSSLEASRALVQFPLTQVIDDRTAGLVPASGNVSFFLRLYNAPHGETLPRQFNLQVAPVSQSWETGTGLDMEDYSDLTRDDEGANWINAASATAWVNQGGDFITSSYVPNSTLPNFKQFFDRGIEDLEIDVTSLIEEWISGTFPNYGVGIFLTGSQESAQRSYFTKRFFARGTEFFFKRPTLEARWDSSLKDQRNFFEASSSLKGSDNIQTIYLYNFVKGALKNIPGIEVGGAPIFVTLHTSASGGSQLTTSPTPITGGFVSTGIYSASFALDTSASCVFDRWFSGSVGYFTGSFEPKTHSGGQQVFVSQDFVSSITNLKPIYSTEEVTRFRLFVRQRNLTPTLFTVASAVPDNNIIEDAYFKVFRLIDVCDVIPYGTGSTNHTKLSYDAGGNYFDVPMNVLEPGYMYGIKLVYLLDGNYEEQPEIFNFRVEEIKR